jgi:phosphoribosylanthranilate isomerase
MSIDIERSQRLFSRFSADQTVVAASGIKTRNDIENCMRQGIRAFLIGESLSTQSEEDDEFLHRLVCVHPSFPVKICGITTPEMAMACLRAGAEVIGLVHYPPSPRHVNTATMHEILDVIKMFGGRSALVVVDQLPDKKTISRFTFVQTYGDIQGYMSGKQIPVVKDFDTFTRLIESYRYGDTPRLYAIEMSEGFLPGGNGVAWDWSIATPFCHCYPTFIAGGITPENVADVVRLAKPFGIDVSSGVESSPGVKDIDKVKRLMDAVHQAIITPPHC